MEYQQDIDSLIEFILCHAEDIRVCVEQKREDDNGHGHTGGGTTGHMRVSDPTALKAIRAVEPIAYIYCPYGPAINNKRDERYIPKPEKWLLVEAATRKRFYDDCADGVTKHIYRSRYLMGDYMENWRQTCMRHVPRISKGTYYTARSSILFYAHQYAYNIGLISPFGKLY